MNTDSSRCEQSNFSLGVSLKGHIFQKNLCVFDKNTYIVQNMQSHICEETFGLYVCPISALSHCPWAAPNAMLMVNAFGTLQWCVCVCVVRAEWGMDDLVAVFLQWKSSHEIRLNLVHTIAKHELWGFQFKCELLVCVKNLGWGDEGHAMRVVFIVWSASWEHFSHSVSARKVDACLANESILAVVCVFRLGA